MAGDLAMNRFVAKTILISDAKHCRRILLDEFATNFFVANSIIDEKNRRQRVRSPINGTNTRLITDEIVKCDGPSATVLATKNSFK